MRTYEDFTVIAAGTRMPMDIAVTVCPRCGRSGVLETLCDGVAEFVHVEMEEVLSDGMLIEPVDWCRITG